ncbi:MAG: hypothetical protein LBT57_02145, partial [Puniceicoccales bacterium]|nr:hypothetical protein [Puniceicoccales bacterium]
YNEKRKKSLEILGKFLVDHQPSPCWEKKDGVYLPRDQELPAHYPRLGEEEKPLAFASCEMVTGTQFVEDPCTPEADRNTRIWALLPRKVQNCLRHWGVVKQVEGKEEIIVQSPLFGTCVVHRPKAVFGARTEKVLRWKWEGEGSVGAEVYLFSVSQGRIRFEGGKNETARGDAPRVSSLASGLSWQGAGRPWNGEICLELAISGREGEALIFYLLIKGTDKTRVSLEILLPQYSENLNMGGIARLLSPEAGRGEDGSGLRR